MWIPQTWTPPKQHGVFFYRRPRRGRASVASPHPSPRDRRFFAQTPWDQSRRNYRRSSFRVNRDDPTDTDFDRSSDDSIAGEVVYTLSIHQNRKGPKLLGPDNRDDVIDG